MPGRIVIVSGATGTGKTSISRLLAEHSACDCAVHIHSDDFYQYIRKGYLSPWMDGAGDQNQTMIESVAASAKRFSEGGYEVFVDGVIGPWFIEPWMNIAREGVDVRYIVLRPSEQTTVSRAADREQRPYFPLTADIVKGVWQSLTNLGEYEPNVVDTTGLTIEESVVLIQKRLLAADFRI